MNTNSSAGGKVPSAFDDDTALAFETEAFAQFDRWIDAELEQLVARWIHTAAPNASRPQSLRHQLGR